MPLDAALVDVFWYRRYVPPAYPGMPRTWTPHYVAFVLRGGECTYPVRVDLGPAAPIDEDVRRFRDAISRDAPDPAARELRARYRKALAARLYGKLFPPALREAIVGRSGLVISPDGTLALLPFGLLLGEDGHEFLLETRTISYVPSGSDLLRAKAPSPPSSGLLAVGAPAFDRVPVHVTHAATVRAGCGAPEDPFAPLAGTATELQAIVVAARQAARPARAVTVLEGRQATKAALLEQAPKAGILHLATHTYFAGEECTPAGSVSTPQRPLGDAPAFLGHNPLLLAGIALAGANERDKADGILTALEITALDLRATDLVVLSACDTGLGILARGQELLGLRWAFAYAGARNLVTSLWTVPDAETATLMGHFYTALWEKGPPVAEALRTAQMMMLKEARARGESAPHTWGAFVASGRPD
jgi:CHAT domain-containing protein